MSSLAGSALIKWCNVIFSSFGLVLGVVELFLSLGDIGCKGIGKSRSSTVSPYTLKMTRFSSFHGM